MIEDGRDNPRPSPTTHYLLMDGRAYGGDLEDALVYSVAETLEEAREDRDECGEPAAIVAADLEGNDYVNLRLIE